MADTSPVKLKGAMGLIKKSKNFFAPLTEAITNSLESMAAEDFRDIEPIIDIKLYYNLGLFGDEKTLDKISITDNGQGFINESYERFKTLLDQSKGFNNRGSGRLQFLHRFGRVKVESIFDEDGKRYRRTFISNENNLVSEHQKVEVSGETLKITTVELIDFKGDKADIAAINALSIDDIKNTIRNRFLLKFYLEQKNSIKVPHIKISTVSGNTEPESRDIAAEDIPTPLSEGEINVPYLKLRTNDVSDIEWITGEKSEILKWAYFKLPVDVLPQNAVCLCSKDVSIQEIPFLKIKKNEAFNGHRHLTAVYGEVLNAAESLSDSVDKFVFPSQKETEKDIKGSLFADIDEEHLFIDTIENSIKAALPEAYREIEQLKENQAIAVEKIALAHGIPEDLAKAINLDLTDTEEKITEKLFKKQAEDLSKESYKIKQLFEALNDLNPTEENYQNELETRGKELLDLIPQQNKQELSRYIIRREMVTKILSLILNNGLDYQRNNLDERKDREGLIHDLIFKRKSTDTGTLNDLWILNEEYLHFDGCSDIAINQIEDASGRKLLRTSDSEDELLAKFGINRTLRRPDIFLYVEEGKCVLIELKAHEVDLSDHLNQLTKYCNLIANCSTEKIEQFYCYLIGENVERVDIPGDFTKAVTGDFVKVNQPIRYVETGKEENIIANIYQEVVQLSSIHRRASVRNKSFADKLGIRFEPVSTVAEKLTKENTNSIP